MPSALAVLRLITSSNLVGCWTGKVGGLFTLENPAEIDSCSMIQSRINLFHSSTAHPL